MTPIRFLIAHSVSVGLWFIANDSDHVLEARLPPTMIGSWFSRRGILVDWAFSRNTPLFAPDFKTATMGNGVLGIFDLSRPYAARAIVALTLQLE